MEIIALVLLVLLLPIVLSLMAIVQVGRLRREMNELRAVWRSQATIPLRRPPPTTEFVAPVVAPDAPAPKVLMSQPSPPEHQAHPPPPAAVAVPRPAVPAQVERPRPPTGRGLEFALGAKIASFVGIAILVAGLAFLVGFAVQHGWLRPSVRVLLGLSSGAALIGAGRWVWRRDQGRHAVLTQALTGGGGAIIFGSVFAAYRVYELVGGWGALAGLLAAAALLFVLAMFYGSQAIGILGVVGAYITPLIIGDEYGGGIFPLLYFALVNVPVILLGARRNWQALYNAAFCFNVVGFMLWLDASSVTDDWGVGLFFVFLFFAQFAALSLLKSATHAAASLGDVVRTHAASVLLLLAVYFILDEMGGEHWLAAWFAGIAVLHGLLLVVSRRWEPRLCGLPLAFLLGGILAATLAIPLQLDGVWTSLFWVIEATILGVLALRTGRGALFSLLSALLNALGAFKLLAFDTAQYETIPALILNEHMLVGALVCGLIALQGHLRSRALEKGGTGAQLHAAAAQALLVALLFLDTFWSLGWGHPNAWILTSAILLLAGFMSARFAPPRSLPRYLGMFFLLACAAKLATFDIVALEPNPNEYRAFDDPLFWAQAALGVLLAVCGWALREKTDSPRSFTAPLAVGLSGWVSFIAVVSYEFFKQAGFSAAPLVTLWWGLCAFVLVSYGLVKSRPYHRYLALVLFTLAAGKVLLVDTASLRGLVRVGIMMGVGLLLLLISFFYQKAASRFDEPDTLQDSRKST